MQLQRKKEKERKKIQNWSSDLIFSTMEIDGGDQGADAHKSVLVMYQVNLITIKKRKKEKQDTKTGVQTWSP